MADDPIPSRPVIDYYVPLAGTATPDLDLLAKKHGAVAPSRPSSGSKAPADLDALAKKHGAYEPGQEYQLDERGRRREVDPFGNLVPRSFRSEAPTETSQPGPGRRPMPPRRSLADVAIDAVPQAAFEDTLEGMSRSDIPPAVGDRITDTLVTGVKGAVSLPGTLVGLADIPTGGRVGKALEESVGFRPGEASRILEDWYSDRLKGGKKEVADADGLLETAVKALSNPEVVFHTVLESIPLMLAGGTLGRLVPGVSQVTAGAVGEGLMSAGATASDLRDQNPDRLLPAGQGAMAVATGAGTTLLGRLGGAIAAKAGLDDIDTLLAAASFDPIVKRNVVQAVLRGLAGAGQEGLLEELPQSVYEQVMQNLATGKPIETGVDEAAVLGALSGGAMGFGANLLPIRKEDDGAGAGDALPQEPYGSVLGRLSPDGGAPMDAAPADQPPPPVPPTAPPDAPLAAPEPPPAPLPVAPQEPPPASLADLGDETALPAPPAPDVEALLAEADQLDAQADAQRPQPTVQAASIDDLVSSLGSDAVFELLGASPWDADIEDGTIVTNADRDRDYGDRDEVTFDEFASWLKSAEAGEGMSFRTPEEKAAFDDNLARARALVGASSEPSIEVIDDAPTTENASGESAASAEALSRQEGMKARGETFMVYDRAGRRRPILGPEAVDYQPKKGETFGIEGPDGFRVLTDNGGKVVQKTTQFEAPPDRMPSNAELLDDARERISNGAAVSPEDAQTLRDLAQEEADANAGAIDGRPDAELSDEELAARLMQRMEAENAPKTTTPMEKVSADYRTPVTDGDREAARVAGETAFRAGHPARVPAKWAVKKELGEAWSKAWHAANIAAPVVPESKKTPITVYRGQQPGQDGAWWTEDRGMAQTFAGMTRRGKSKVGEVREDTLQPDDVKTLPYLVTSYATPTAISQALGIPVQATSLDLKPDADVRVHAYLEQPEVHAALRDAGVKVVGAREMADKGRDVRVFMRVPGAVATETPAAVPPPYRKRAAKQAAEKKAKQTPPPVADEEDGGIEYDPAMDEGPHAVTNGPMARMSDAELESLVTNGTKSERTLAAQEQAARAAFGEAGPGSGITANDLERMAVEDIMPAPEKTVSAKALAGKELLTPDEASARIDAWKQESYRIGREEDHSNEVIFSLFDRTGGWSEPWVNAGYDVRTYDIATGDDLQEFFPMADIVEAIESGKKIVGVLAAPPCTSFAVSGARWWADQHDKADVQMVEKKYGYRASRYFDTPLDYANTLVAITQAFIEFANPSRFHAMENPVGRIAAQNDLPKPLLSFDPSNFGNPYTKKTFLWGSFNPNLPTANVDPSLGSYISVLRGDDPAQKAERSTTPEGFAYAFFMANHPTAAAKQAAEKKDDAAQIDKPKAAQPAKGDDVTFEVKSLQTGKTEALTLPAKPEKRSSRPPFEKKKTPSDEAMERIAAEDDAERQVEPGWSNTKPTDVQSGGGIAGLFGGSKPKVGKGGWIIMGRTSMGWGPTSSWSANKVKADGAKQLEALKSATNAGPLRIETPDGTLVYETPAWKTRNSGRISATPTARGYVGAYTDGDGIDWYHDEAFPKVDSAFDAARALAAKRKGPLMHRYNGKRVEYGTDDWNDAANIDKPAKARKGSRPPFEKTPPGGWKAEDKVEPTKKAGAAFGRESMAPTFTEIGKNTIGQTIYEDGNGVRSYVENGVRQSEAVGMVPTRQGVQTTVQRDGDGRPKDTRYQLATVHPSVVDTRDDLAREVNATIGAAKKMATERQPAVDELPKTPALALREWVTVDEGTGVIAEISREGDKVRIDFNNSGRLSKWINASRVTKGRGDTASDAPVSWAHGGTAERPALKLGDAVNFKGDRHVITAPEQDGMVTVRRNMEQPFLVRADALSKWTPKVTPQVPALGGMAPLGAKDTPAADPKAATRAALDAKRAQAKEEIAAAAAALRAELKKANNSLNTGLPTPPAAVVVATVKLVRLYAKVGIIEVGAGWESFKIDMGELADSARQAFQFAWESVYGTRPDAALLTTEDSDAGNRGDADGGRLAADRGEAADAVRADGEGALGETPSVADAVAEDDAEGAGSRGAESDAPVAVSGRPGGSEDGDAPNGAGTRDEGPALPATRVGTGEVAPAPPSSDYQLTPERLDAITNRTDLERAVGNVAAIELVQALRAEGRHATPDEQEVLAKYVGWGSSELSRLLGKSTYGLKGTWLTLYQKLQNLTTEDERDALKHSSLNAHYTYGIYKPLWEALERAGFTQGRVLEPSVGTGHAFGAMPADMRAASTLRAVELEPFTAAIAQALYPSARVQNAGYQKAALPNGAIDLAISNVPFGDYDVVDLSKPDFVTEYIHNYFFDKALDHVRPGGLVVFVTSKGTMDQSGGQQFRRHLMSRAHFIGSVRLPGGDEGAFSEGAKTAVVTDLIVLQRKLADQDTHPNDDLFIDLATVKLPSKSGDSVSGVKRSAWYSAHPELVIGREAMTGKMYGRPNGYNVDPVENFDAEFARALAAILPAGTYKPRQQQELDRPRTAADETARVNEFVVKDGKLFQVDENRELVPMTLAKESQARVVGMVGVRDALKQLRATMRDPASTDADVKAGQATLKKLYTAFTKKHGLLNKKVNVDLFALDPESPNILGLEIIEPKASVETNKNGEEKVVVTRTLKALSAIFEKRVIGPRSADLSAKTAKDALLMSLGATMRVDWTFMARVRGQSESVMQAELLAEGLVFEQPDGTWVTSDEYLSGDVVTKLADARAEGGAKMARNITALEAIQPVPKKPGEVPIMLGSTYVPADVYMDFLADTLGLNRAGITQKRDDSVALAGTSQVQQWGIPAWSHEARGVAANHPLSVEYGPALAVADEKFPFGRGERYTLLDLFGDAMNLRQPKATYTVKVDKTTKTVEVPEATAALRANLDEVQGLFDAWLVAHPQTHADLTTIYNDRYNREVPRVFDGAHLAPVLRANGMSLPFDLHKHQINAIWRALATGNTLLGHEVGAGKTYEMIGIAMEMRRTGRASKPMITVPTHIVDDVKKATIEMYPDAKILSFESEDLGGKKRRAAMARIANGDWDIVLVPHSSFTLLSSSPESRNRLLKQWIREAEEAHEATYRRESGNDSSPAVKAAARVLAKVKGTLEKKIEQAAAKKDDNLYWEDLGVDALIVDEAHSFKNLFFLMNMDPVRGVSQSNAMKSLDVYVKVQSINQASGYRNLIFATATPLMNSMVEAFTMQRYLQPQTLAAAGAESFENWYRLFGKAGMVTEPLPDGTYREVLRVKEFRNLDALSKMFRKVMDYIGWDDMPYLKLPKAVFHVVETPKHPMYDSHLLPNFALRIAVLKQQPSIVNHIKKTYTAPLRAHPLTGQPIPGVPDLLIQVLESAKQAAIDARLIFGGAATDFRQSRIQTAADRMFASYKKNKASKGVQLAFMDVGIPKNPGTLPFLSNAAAIETDDETDEEMSDDETGDEAEFGGIDYSTGFNLYDALRDALIQRGVPATEIAYLHQARNGAERRALFDAANEGKVRFVFASTEKGGVGMNIQRRMSDIHAIDAPRFLRPGDEQQRLGRGIRQGNIFEEVHIHRYVTKGTSDEWLLQVLGIKRDVGLAFMRGVAVEFQEPDASSVSLDEAMARASGDERAIERIELKASYQRVKAQADGQRRAVAMAVGRVNSLRAYVADLRKRKERAEDFIRDSFRSLKGDQFEITVGGKTYADRKEATEALRAVFYTFIGDTEVRYTSDPQKRIRPIGEIGGLPLSIRFEPAPSWRSDEAPTAVIELDATGIGGDKLRVVGTFAVEKAVDEFNLSMSAQNRYEDVGRLAEELSEKLSKAEIDLSRTEDIIDNPPAIIAKSEQMKARIAVLDAALASDSEEKSKALIEKARAYLNNGGRLVRDLKAKAPAAGKTKASGPKGPSGDASVAPAVQMVVRAGLAADLPATTSKQMGGLTTAKPAAVPELVAFIDEVGGGTKIMRSLRAQGARGMHSEGFITLVADLFKAGNKVELARVLAHEIGHLIDWLPDGDMKRGNVLGRLRSLHAFLKHRYTNVDGDTIKVQTVRDELLALSKEWRPWPDDAPASYHVYRKRGRELYADAISALLNDPLAVKETAPTFFAEFFNELDNKPEVKTAYLDLMELLSGTPEELRARRRGRVRGMFDRGNTKSLDLVALAMAEKEQRAYSLWQKLKIDHYEKHGAIADRVDQWEKVHGRKVNPEDDPRLLLSEMAHIRGGVKGFVNEHFEPVYAALREADIDWNTFGEVLFYDRILAGDASETANPGGLSPEHVQDMRDDAVNSLSAKQRAVIETQADAFRGALRLVAEQAHEAGLYTDEMYEQMQKNPAYVTFRVLDYLDQNVTSSVYRRTGSLKDIQHVAESSIMKAIVTLKAAEHNRTKRDVFQWFEDNVGKDEGGFERAPMRWNGKGWEPAEPKDRRLKLITFKVKGKPAGVYVDAYVAKSFETLAPEDLGVILRGLRLVTGKFMRPVFTTMNPGFMTFNVVRDFLRAWKAMPQWSFRKALSRYVQAVPMAAARAVPMRPGQKGAAWRQRAEAALKAAESAKILDLTLADIHGEDRIEDTNIDQVFADVGISSYAAEEGRLRRVLGWVEAVGDFIETLPKAAAIIEMTGGNTFPEPIDVKLLDPAERNKIRDRVGSPDFQQGGAQTPRSNGLFIFSNAIIRGIAGDLKTASEPETAGGWWFKTAMVNIAPKLLTAGLLYAALGGGDDDDEEDNWLEYGQRVLRGVSEYDFTNYNIVPLGLDEYGESIYARIPQDDFGRLIGGLAWKAISLAGKDAEDRDAVGDVLDVFDFTAGQLPGMNPMMRVPVDIAQVLSGNNVYDSFRSRMVFTPDEVAARDERMLKKFVGYEFQQLGGSIVWRFIPGDERHVEKGTLRKVVEFPIVSNVMGRWIRVGDRGRAEALRGVTDGVKRDEARARLDERQAVNRAISVVAAAAPPDRARVAKEQARAIMAEVHEGLKGDAAGEKQRAIEKKLKFGLARGSADPYLETLMSQTSNAQKTAVVVRAKRDMTPPQFQSWLRRGVQEGVISKAVEMAARKAK